jgi:hypothetical protein
MRHFIIKIFLSGLICAAPSAFNASKYSKAEYHATLLAAKAGIERRISIFRYQYKRLPTTSEGLKILATCLPSIDCSKYPVGLTRSTDGFLDPWGKPFIYEFLKGSVYGSRQEVILTLI